MRTQRNGGESEAKRTVMKQKEIGKTDLLGVRETDEPFILDNDKTILGFDIYW